MLFSCKRVESLPVCNTVLVVRAKADLRTDSWFLQCGLLCRWQKPKQYKLLCSASSFLSFLLLLLLHPMTVIWKAKSKTKKKKSTTDQTFGAFFWFLDVSVAVERSLYHNLSLIHCVTIWSANRQMSARVTWLCMKELCVCGRIRVDCVFSL